MRGSSPAAFMRLKVSRQDIPASTRMVVVALRMMALFPRLPEASTETETPMTFEHTRSRSGNGSNFSVIRYLSAYVPNKSQLDVSDAIDLDQRIAGNPTRCDGYRGTHRRLAAEASEIHFVHAGIVFDVVQVDVHLQDLLHG
jgi:hypothetical protein